MQSFGRSGRGFQNLYNSPPVQAFLNQLPSKQLHNDKAIYQPGSLRMKASSSFCKSWKKNYVLITYFNITWQNKDTTTKQLGKIVVSGRGISAVSLTELCPSSVFLPPPLTTMTPVTSFNAVVAQSGQLAHCGSFVRVQENEEVCLAGYMLSFLFVMA